MTVCVVGAGGREHALADVLARSDDVVVTPGNPGMPGTSESGHRITVTDAAPDVIDADLYVIGPEAPLVDGLAERLRADGRRVLGPGTDGARLEGSKAFMKEMLAEANVPTARFGTFERVDDAQTFLRTLPGPWVVKTDGLAAGKGVLVATTLAEADADIEAKLSGDAFGDAGRRIVVEEGLVGTECSLLVLCDGSRVVPLAPAQDFKRLGDDDAGPNTGGMGSYSPVPAVGDELVGVIVERAVAPLVDVLRAHSIDYRGVLYAGLMLTDDGPKVLEYNVRFGDPEAQVILPLLAEDPVALLGAAADGDLSAFTRGRGPRFSSEAAVCVVLAAPGYPGSVRTGDPISGLAPDGRAATERAGVAVYHAGTRRDDPAGPFTTAGGRVLGVRAVGPTIAAARAAAYETVGTIHWEGVQYRTDIAAAAAAAGGAASDGTGRAKVGP